MDLAIAEEFCVFQAWNQSQDARLLSELQVVLKADKVIGIGAQILAPQLNHSIRPLARLRIVQSYRLHRSEPQRVAAATRDLFNWETAFKIVQLLPVMAFHRLCLNQRVIKSVIFILGERAIDIVGSSFAVAGGKVHARLINGIRINNGTDGIVKIKM